MARARTFDATTLAAAGLQVVRRSGWSSVTMRSTAEELGVSPMALYRLTPTADHLRQLVANAAAPGLRPTVGPLADVLQAWAVDAYRHLRRLPGVASYVVLHWTELPAWLDVIEALLARADDSGLSGPPAVATVNAVFAYVLVRAQLHDGLSTVPRRSMAPLRADPARYPLLTHHRPEFARAQTDHHFQFGLTALIAGLPLPPGV